MKGIDNICVRAILHRVFCFRAGISRLLSDEEIDVFPNDDL